MKGRQPARASAALESVHARLGGVVGFGSGQGSLVARWSVAAPLGCEDNYTKKFELQSVTGSTLKASKDSRALAQPAGFHASSGSGREHLVTLEIVRRSSPFFAILTGIAIVRIFRAEASFGTRSVFG